MKTIIAATTVASFTVAIAVFAAREFGDTNPPETEYDNYHRFIFYAVLEGCYEDGIKADDIDLIVPKNEENGMRELSTNFVYTCPLCHPAFEAFRIYGSRLPFVGQKITRYDTFGAGLDEATRKQLRGTPNERRNAIQGLISKWVGARAELLRLNKEERIELMKSLKEMKGKGDAALKKFQEGEHGNYFTETYKDWKKCPVCEGSLEAKMGL